jgi:hypothetical protein
LRGRVLGSNVGLNTGLVRAGSRPLRGGGLLLTLLLELLRLLASLLLGLLRLLASLTLRRDGGLGTIRFQTVQKVLCVLNSTLRVAPGVRGLCGRL